MSKVILMIALLLSSEAFGGYFGAGIENHRMFGRRFSNGRAIMLGWDIFEAQSSTLTLQSTYITTRISDNYAVHVLGLDFSLRSFALPHNFYAGISVGFNEIYLEYKELDSSYSKKLYPGYGFLFGYQAGPIFTEFSFRRINNLNLRYHQYYADKTYEGFAFILGMKI